jgi:hypothetical protein
MSSHCADAVISLANQSTIVARVSSTLVEFMARWTQSPSGYDFLVASTIDRDWAAEHQPVISRHRYGHSLYTRFRLEEPGGRILRCPTHGRQSLRSRSASKHTMRIICDVDACRYRCTIPKASEGIDNILRTKGLVRTEFPQLQYTTTWTWYSEAEDDITQRERHRTTSNSTPSAWGTLSIPSTYLRPPSPITRTSSSPAFGSMPPPSSNTIRVPPPPSASTMHRSRSASAINDRRSSVAETPPPTPTNPGRELPRKRPTTRDGQGEPKRKRK